MNYAGLKDSVSCFGELIEIQREKPCWRKRRVRNIVIRLPKIQTTNVWRRSYK